MSKNKKNKLLRISAAMVLSSIPFFAIACNNIKPSDNKKEDNNNSITNTDTDNKNNNTNNPNQDNSALSGDNNENQTTNNNGSENGNNSNENQTTNNNNEAEDNGTTPANNGTEPSDGNLENGTSDSSADNKNNEVVFKNEVIINFLNIVNSEKIKQLLEITVNANNDKKNQDLIEQIKNFNNKYGEIVSNAKIIMNYGQDINTPFLYSMSSIREKIIAAFIIDNQNNYQLKTDTFVNNQKNSFELAFESLNEGIDSIKNAIEVFQNQYISDLDKNIKTTFSDAFINAFNINLKLKYPNLFNIHNNLILDKNELVKVQNQYQSLTNLQTLYKKLVSIENSFAEIFSSKSLESFNDNLQTRYKTIKSLIYDENNKIIFDNLTDSNILDYENLLNEFKNKYQFILKANNALNINLNKNLKNYELDKAINPLSITNSNFDYYINSNLTDENLSANLVKFDLDLANNNILKIEYNVADNATNMNTNVIKELTFPNSWANKLSELSNLNIHDLFNFNKTIISNYTVEEFFANESIVKENIIPKKTILNDYFTYELDDQDPYDKQNKSFNILIKHNNQVIKRFSLIANDVLFINSNHEVTFATFSEEFKKSKYYTNPSEFGNSLANYFSYAMSEKEKAYNESHPNATKLLINPLWNKVPVQKDLYFTQEQRLSMFKEVIKGFITNINADDIQPYNDATLINLIQEVNAIQFWTDNKTKLVQVQVNASEASEDNKNLNLIKKTLGYSEYWSKLQNLNPVKSNLFANIQAKNPNVTHSDFVAYDNQTVLKLLNEIYTFPSFGEYQIFIKEIKNVSPQKGKADLFFWYKKNNEEAVLPKNFGSSQKVWFTLEFFKPLTFEDVKTIDGTKVFKAVDFQGQNYSSIDKTDMDNIKLINSTNFDYRMVNALWDNKTPIPYAVIDPYDIYEQEAFLKINYVLKFKNGSLNKDKETEDKNENNDKFNNNFEDNPKTTDENKPIPEPTVINFNPNSRSIANPRDLANSVNMNTLANKYFIYFVNVKPFIYQNTKGMSFQLGFINKNNLSQRFISPQTIRLVNLQNDYKNNLYPEVILNNITFDDLSIIKNSKTFTIKDLANTVSQPLLRNSYITLNIEPNSQFDYPVIKYNNFYLNANNIQIAEVIKKDNDDTKAYFRLKYVEGNKVIQGNRWYVIEDLRAQDNDIINKTSLSYSNNNLKEIYTPNSVHRERIIEPYYKDLEWNKLNNGASWLLKKKYYEKTLLNHDVKNAKIKLHIFGNVLFQDDYRLKRITDIDKGMNIEVDFNSLKETGKYHTEIDIQPIHTSNNGKFYNSPNITINVDVLYTEAGIQFNLTPNNEQYNIILGNPLNHVLSTSEFLKKFGHFDSNEAILIAKQSNLITISYDSNVQNENFGISTNKFDYNHMSYTQENQPILFYNDYNEIWNTYLPNQNVPYKLHDGYMLNNEYLGNSYTNTKLFQTIWGNSMAYNYGSATKMGKVNTNKNDGKFYLVTNTHVENYGDIQSLKNKPHQANWRYLVKSGHNFANNINSGFGYWDGLYPVGVNPQVIWVGKDQLNVNGTNPASVDMTIFSIDINQIIKTTMSEGRYQTAYWYKQWFDDPYMDMNYEGGKDNVVYGPYVIRNGINGFPYAKQAGYVVNRASIYDSGMTLQRQNGYVPTYFNPGNSGTGIMGDENSFNSVINSGTPFNVLYGHNFISSQYNYLGLNSENNDPLSLKNKNSFASILFNLNVRYPYQYDIPWFIKNNK
ncbi:MGA_1079 family surface serine endopeptidase [Metamycoplasma neophronis]|uniref:DUF31 domain-containing protein n=1 Tax=Metamycoplasma neophronis TaxID=872983 RepID=A0ABY2Z568_9BACT|nr:hypothetical protein [Metamycoplasma neophronis]TPR54048.1 hypothetical protein FJR74_01230 [Metamycoplasma neophronis]